MKRWIVLHTQMLPSCVIDSLVPRFFQLSLSLLFLKVSVFHSIFPQLLSHYWSGWKIFSLKETWFTPPSSNTLKRIRVNLKLLGLRHVFLQTTSNLFHFNDLPFDALSQLSLLNPHSFFYLSPFLDLSVDKKSVILVREKERVCVKEGGWKVRQGRRDFNCFTVPNTFHSLWKGRKNNWLTWITSDLILTDLSLYSLSHFLFPLENLSPSLLAKNFLIRISFLPGKLWTALSLSLYLTKF